MKRKVSVSLLFIVDWNLTHFITDGKKTLAGNAKKVAKEAAGFAAQQAATAVAEQVSSFLEDTPFGKSLLTSFLSLLITQILCNQVLLLIWLEVSLVKIEPPSHVSSLINSYFFVSFLTVGYR